jgi:hypothetical protein
MNILGFPLRPILRKFLLPQLLAGNSRAGFKTAGIFVPPEDVVDDEEVVRFKQCVAEFIAKDGEMHAHPGFGKMNKDGFNRFHAAHAAHHLGFLEPSKHAG